MPELAGKFILTENADGSFTLSGTARVVGNNEPDTPEGPILVVDAPEPYVQYRGYEQRNPDGTKPPVDGVVFDARGQTFFQSATSNPDIYGPETYTGPDAEPRQIYPVRPGVHNCTWWGGTIVGRHPIDYDIATFKQNAPEDQPYVNSAALLMDGGKSSVDGSMSTNLTVQGVKITAVWDGIRFAPYEDNHISTPGKYHHNVRGCHIAEVLDDAIENDHGQTILLIDNLIEDVFVLISARVTNGEDHSVDDVVIIEDTLIKVAPRVDTGSNTPGTFFICPYKSNPVAPRLSMQGSVLALHGEPATWSGKLEQWQIMWDKLEDLGGNWLLWLDDTPLPGPELIGDVPPGFEVLTGEKARDAWEAVRTRWIVNHPEVGS